VNGLYEAKLPPRIVLTSAEEVLADSALLILSRLRDHLVHRNANRTAERFDKISDDVVRACLGRELEVRHGNAND
jgi:hypothetical protein